MLDRVSYPYFTSRIVIFTCVLTFINVKLQTGSGNIPNQMVISVVNGEVPDLSVLVE